MGTIGRREFLAVAGEVAGRVVGEGGRVDGRVAVGQGIDGVGVRRIALRLAAGSIPQIIHREGIHKGIKVGYAG